MEFVGTYYVPVSEDGTFAIPDAWSACFSKNIVLMRIAPEVNAIQCILMTAETTLNSEALSEVNAIECIPESSDYERINDMGHVACKEKAEVNATCSVSHDCALTNLADGRLMIPENMRKELGITHQVVLVGAFNTFWIWESSVWEDEQSGCGSG